LSLFSFSRSHEKNGGKSFECVITHIITKLITKAKCFEKSILFVQIKRAKKDLGAFVIF
jgi:hypothetical protein